MSRAHAELFAQELQTDPALLAQVRAGGLQSLLDMGARRGYSLDFDEAKLLAQNLGGVGGNELSDSQLDHVTGGWSSYKEG